MPYVEVSKEQAYAHSLRLFRAVSEWRTTGGTDMVSAAQDMLALAYFMLPDEPMLFGDAAEDPAIADMTSNLVAAAALINPADGMFYGTVAGRNKGLLVNAAIAVLLKWIKEQVDVTDVIEWIFSKK
ncbi:MAG: hypothetical protein O3C28_18525 [Proteobacteria bacterium]|nr:hypothetical protein [Pseudomonadota bacterium]